MTVTFPRINPIIFNENPIPAFEYYNDPFVQLWNKTDFIIFQVTYDNDFTSGEIIAKLIDSNGLTYDFENDIVVAGNIYQSIFRISCNVPDGIYRILLTTSGNKFKYYSNYMNINADNGNTLLIQYQCSKNKFDCIFRTNEYAYSFLLRLPGGVKSSDISYKSDDVNYIDQDRSIHLIDSIPYAMRKYTFGDSAGLANWIVDKLNRIFSCDDININNVKVVKDDGASLETVSNQGYPYVGANINLFHQEEGYSETLYGNTTFLQSGTTINLMDAEHSYSIKPPKTGRIHIKTFEETFS